MNLTIDPYAAAQNPNLIGELLRDKFFAQDRTEPNYTFGCYSTFEVRDGVKKLPSEPVPEWDIDVDPPVLKADSSCEHAFTVYELDDVTMKYYWDGDGFLMFKFPDGGCLVNTDCKKDYCWQFHPEGYYEY